MDLRRGAVRGTRVGAVLVGLALLVAGCSTPGPGPNPAASLPVVAPGIPAALQPYYAQRISFSTCPTNNDVQCGWVNVPIDYQDVALGSMRLRVAYHPTGAQGARRLGYLFTNPGGPGASGLDIPYHAGDYVSDKIVGQFDVLGWDPRGVGLSDPIRCLTNKQKDAYFNLNATPTTPAAISRYVAAQKTFAWACKVRNPKLYDHVGTVAAAHDMDIIRAALGQSEMYYLGFSYGTVLGAWYAEQFPKRITRMVLDGAMNPALDNTQASFEQMHGFENALYRFLNWCPTSGGCPKALRLPTEQQRINVIIAEQNLLAKIPAPTGDKNRPLTKSLFQTGMVYALYDDTFGWPQLSYALSGLLQKGNGTEMLALADRYLGRLPNGTYPDNNVDAFSAVTCYDKPPTPALPGTLGLVKQWSVAAPILGSNFAWANITCAYWQAFTKLKPGPLHAKGAAPIVIIGTKYDPATPYNEAVALASQLQSGHLITWIGDGHTAYNRGSACVQHAVDDYLLHGFIPKKGLVCPAISPPD